jgi:hypothetical protein
MNYNYTHKYKNPEVVKQIEEQYPEMTTEYKRIIMEGYETFCAKQSNHSKPPVLASVEKDTNDKPFSRRP